MPLHVQESEKVMKSAGNVSPDKAVCFEMLIMRPPFTAASGITQRLSVDEASAAPLRHYAGHLW
ncbi:MAG: hypothetical protein KDB00_22870 [Planctomycetales bacterium]|nr:hypothetical protein [Planctomycetales bacterium]